MKEKVDEVNEDKMEVNEEVSEMDEEKMSNNEGGMSNEALEYYAGNQNAFEDMLKEVEVS